VKHSGGTVKNLDFLGSAAGAKGVSGVLEKAPPRMARAFAGMIVLAVS
jgi:hypothetical protein